MKQKLFKFRYIIALLFASLFPLMLPSDLAFIAGSVAGLLTFRAFDTAPAHITVKKKIDLYLSTFDVTDFQTYDVVSEDLYNFYHWMRDNE